MQIYRLASSEKGGTPAFYHAQECEEKQKQRKLKIGIKDNKVKDIKKIEIGIKEETEREESDEYEEVVDFICHEIEISKEKIEIYELEE